MATPYLDELERVRVERDRAARRDGEPSTAHAGPTVEWDDVRPWPTLDGAALDGLAGDVVRILEPHTEADPAALLVTFLTLFGNAVGSRSHVRVGAAQHPARLFVCLVGDTARARKGQSFAEVGSLFELADPAWWDAARAGGLTSGEGIIARVRDDDQHQIEKRAHFYEPEFARTLAAAARDGSTLSPVLRDAWDSGRLAVTTRKDPLVATGAHIGVVAHITLEELRARLTSLDIANGFANRFLFTCVRRSKKLASGGTLNEATRHELGTKVGAALRSARTRTLLTRTPTAEATWRSVYENLPEPPGLFGAVTARADAQLLRLSLVYALLNKADRIHDTHIEPAVAVWRYAEASAAHVFGGVLGSDLPTASSRNCAPSTRRASVGRPSTPCSVATPRQPHSMPRAGASCDSSWWPSGRNSAQGGIHGYCTLFQNRRRKRRKPSGSIHRPCRRGFLRLFRPFETESGAPTRGRLASALGGARRNHSTRHPLARTSSRPIASTSTPTATPERSRNCDTRRARG
jgi:hypothetical protein